ncbi:CTP-dependent riboflavin kinase [Aromatoleum toluclasticum]|uniref:CTP-dependent riboflavin kinase n=1 Tax=Aromatoleum toluclasticum TaxID=92003 RepID=UPI001D186E64|nr:CTP-dependent riboflavin kinase [Aromatoleum toluclasticum]MCC4114609.1 CTP-dependent riboflavin kinase [Aromatoleum toluclasticum]
MMTTASSLELEGEVAPGLGEGSRFTAIDWVILEFRRKLGFIPWPGTFNLRMRGGAWDWARARMLTATGIAITPRDGFCAAKCFGVNIAGHLTGAVVFPEMPDYPDDKFEIVAPLPIRETLGLQDGDLVNLRLDLFHSARDGAAAA